MNLYPILNDIFKRILFRYYPASLFFSTLTLFTTKNIIFNEVASTGALFISMQLVMLTSWSIIFIVLYIHKPTGLIKVLADVTGVLFCGVIIQYMVFALFLDFSLWPFTDSAFANKTIVMLLMNTVWCGGTFFLAEKSIVAEKKYEKEKTERLKSEKELIENQLSLLQARIEPQFLFNTMESISGLFDTAPEKAIKLQKHFIQYLRVSLRKTRERYSTVEQEMELIRSYLDIFKEGMEERFAYMINMDPKTVDWPFPSMLIQPVVENAIKNSIEKSHKGGQISIIVQQKEERIQIIITDTGICSIEEDNLDLLFGDIKEHLKSLYGKKGILQLKNNRPSGLSVTIEVPYE